MKDLASITKQGVQKLIDCKVLDGWEDNRIYFPCPYSDDNEHYMISFNTSEEQASAYNIVFNNIYKEKIQKNINMRICVYFAVNEYQNYMYLTERKLHTFNNASKLFDLICDQNSLENELNWNKIDKTHKPTTVGIYQAVVEYVQTADDDYRLDVISCTPICLI